MPIYGYRSNQFILVEDKTEKMPSMAIGSGSLSGDPLMPRLQFRDWMGDTSTDSSAINDIEESLVHRSGLPMNVDENIVDTENLTSVDQDPVDYMTESMLSFVLGSVALFLAAVSLILMVFFCVRAYRRRQIQQEEANSIENPAGYKHVVYPVRSLDIPRRQLDEILRRSDPKRNPLDF